MSARYRASMCKAVLDSVEALAPGLITQLPAEDVETIRGAGRTGWIDAIVLEGVQAAILQLRGEATLRDINRSHTRNAISLPVFGPLVKGATNLFGGGPRGLLRVMPSSWELVTRDCGKLSVEFPTDTSAAVTYAELAPVLRTRAFVLSSTASPMGVLEGLGFRGSVEADDSQIAQGLLILHVRWTK